MHCQIPWLSANVQYQLKQQTGTRSLWEQSCGEGLGSSQGEKLDMNQQPALADQRESCILGCIKSSGSSWVKEVILPLSSALVRPHLQCCVRSGVFSTRKSRPRGGVREWLGAGLPLLQRWVEASGVVQHGEEKGLGKSHCDLLVT